MADGRFDNQLEINEHGCLTPGGPLELAKSETVLRLDAWIWQDSSACIAVQHNVPDGEKWKITTDPHENHVGPGFKTGAAAAMGIMVSKTANGETKTYQWADAVFLYKDGKRLEVLLAAAKSEAMLTS
jgi:hypothetical protein